MRKELRALEIDDAENLREAIQSVSPGGILKLHAGDYYLDGPVEIEGISILGAFQYNEELEEYEPQSRVHVASPTSPVLNITDERSYITGLNIILE